MRLLFVANRMPYPPYRGDKLKIYNLAKELQHHSLDLITIAENQEDIDSIEPLSRIFNRIDYVFIPRWKSFLNTFFTLFSNEPFQIGYFRSARFKAKLSEIDLKSFLAGSRKTEGNQRVQESTTAPAFQLLKLVYWLVPKAHSCPANPSK